VIDEPSTQRTAPPSDAGRWALLALCTTAFTLNAASVLSVAPLAPLFRDDLGLSRAQVGLFLSAVYLGGVLMSLPAGWVTERLGIRSTLTGGLLRAPARSDQLVSGPVALPGRDERGCRRRAEPYSAAGQAPKDAGQSPLRAP